MKTKFEFALNLKTVKALFPSGVVGSFAAVHESVPGTNAKSSNVRATAAFGAEGDINQNIPDCLQLDHPVRALPAIQRWSGDRAAGRQRVGQLGDLVARKPKRPSYRVGSHRRAPAELQTWNRSCRTTLLAYAGSGTAYVRSSR
jgi:hypothetical protein